MSISQQQVEAGQAVYTKPVLAFYDGFVLGFSNRWVWRCPSARILALYDRHVTANHLDVGVGTGFFLDRCRFPESAPRLALMDLNPNALEACARRVARYQPSSHRHNVLEPIAFEDEPFASIGLSYLLHCLPGTMTSKAVVFDHLKPLLRPDGVIFGATLLQGGVPRSWGARRLMKLYNAKGIFSNRDDDLEVLRAELGRRFHDVQIEVVGCAALFSARR